MASVTPTLLPSTDRTYLLPRHTGYNVFPNSPIFGRLLRHAHRGRLSIRDVNLRIEKTFGELLSDVLGLRAIIQASLTPETLKSLQREEDVYIGVLAPGGYEYTVAILAVLAIGAAAVPMTVTLPTEEALYFVTKSKQVAILTAVGASELGTSIATHVNRTQDSKLHSIDILSNLPRHSLAPTEMRISADRYLSDNSAGVVIFTSGTTGPPKGAVMRRAFVHDSALAVADHYEITSADVILHVLPVHHATGIGISFFPFLLSGALIEFRSGSFDLTWMWERWRKGGLTFFSGVPTIYMRMMRYYEQNLKGLSEAGEYVRGANQFRAMLCGSSALPRPIQAFWTEMRRGKTILTRYGATEYGAVFKENIERGDTPDGSVGKAVAGVDVKLSDGDEGEILVRSPHMFSKYLFDDHATVAAHDVEGYFRTGDIGHRKGEYYWIDGRASMDIIKSGGYKISALDIERELLGLSYISEAMVVGVADDEFGQRVGAVVSLRDDPTEYSTRPSGRPLRLDDVRRDLRSRLVGYKLPTLLRVFRGELPKGQSGKVLKRTLGPQLFPSPGWERHPEIQAWTSRTPEHRARL